MVEPLKGWWSISGEALMQMLREAHAGESPDIVYAEAVSESEHMKPAKPCTRCNKVQILERYRFIGGKPESWCKTCRNLAIADWGRRNPASRAASQRRAQLKRKYGLTEADYDRILEAQGFVCAVCQKPEGRVVRAYGKVRVARLSVDHDHTTGRIRGLLCRDCNKALGLANDDPELLRRLARYVETRANVEHYANSNVEAIDDPLDEDGGE